MMRWVFLVDGSPQRTQKPRSELRRKWNCWSSKHTRQMSWFSFITAFSLACTEYLNWKKSNIERDASFSCRTDFNVLIGAIGRQPSTWGNSLGQWLGNVGYHLIQPTEFPCLFDLFASSKCLLCVSQQQNQQLFQMQTRPLISLDWVHLRLACEWILNRNCIASNSASVTERAYNHRSTRHRFNYTSTKSAC